MTPGIFISDNIKITPAFNFGLHHINTILHYIEQLQMIAVF